MSNKFSGVNSSKLLDNKLSILLSDFNQKLKDSKVVEQEDILSQFNELVAVFNKTLNNPLFDDSFIVKSGDPVNVEVFNSLFRTALQDIEILYKEISSLHTEIVRNFNNVTISGDRIKAKLKSVRSKIANFKLYSNNKDLLFVKDSFDNFDMVEKEADLYNAKRCNLNLNEGTITLPLKSGSSSKIKVSKVFISPVSNGVLGNNQEVGQLQRSSLNSITDNNPDTWVEYELVKRESFATPLVMELNLVLAEESVVNNIEIQAATFAVRNFPRLIDVKTSLDGNFFVDLIQDLPLDEDEGNPLVLSPSAGKASGINSFSFKPRKAKYIRLKVQQDDSYLVNTPSGVQFRKAIGIRSINVNALQYEPAGEIVSTRHLFSDEIKTLGLDLTKNTFGDLTSLSSQITVDDNIWLDISPLSEVGTEIISFNTIDTSSVNTDSPVVGVRYKAKLSRNKEAFEGASQVIKRESLNTEFQSINPTTSSMQLSETPIPGSTNVYGVSFGQVGGDALVILNSDLVETDNNLYIQLPKAFQNRFIDKDSFSLVVNGEPWTRTSSLSGASSTDKLYVFDGINNRLKTGNNINGKKPSGDIRIFFKREQVLFSQDIPRTATLNFSSDSVKDSFNLYRLGSSETISNFVLQKEANILRLGRQDIISIAIISDDNSVLNEEQVFINGAEENTIPGHYSIDYINGIIYTYDTTPSDSDLVINFTYKPRTLITNFSIEGDSLTIADSEYTSHDGSYASTLNSVYVIDLGKTFVEPKSLQFLSLASSFQREVPFRGDGSEFRLDLPEEELTGLFTVDYKKGKIYMNAPLTGDLSVRFRYSSIFAEYNIARKLSPSDFTSESNILKFSEDFIIREFGNSLTSNNSRNLFKVGYKYIEETHDDLKELEPYYTPFLRSYNLKVISRSKF